MILELGSRTRNKAVENRSRTPKIGDVVLAIDDGEFTIKPPSKNKAGQPKLMPKKKPHKPIE